METELSLEARTRAMITRAASLDMGALMYNLHDITGALYARREGYNFSDPYNKRVTEELAVYSAELTRRAKRATSK